MSDKKITPEQIKSARKHFGLTQKQAANLINVELRSWQRYESNEREMSASLFELFNIKAKELKEKSYFSFKDLAILKLGGRHPQSVSGLTNAQDGKIFLLPSMPPAASFDYELTKETRSIFDLTFGFHLKTYFYVLANLFVTRDVIEEKEIINDLEVILGLTIKRIMKFQAQVKNSAKEDWKNLNDISLQVLKLVEVKTGTCDKVISNYNYFIASNIAYALNNMDLRDHFINLLENMQEWQDLCKSSFSYILSNID